MSLCQIKNAHRIQRTRTQDRSAKYELVARIAQLSRCFGKIKKAADMSM